MAAVTDLVTTLREADNPDERRRAASDLVEVATAEPDRLRPSFAAVIGALDDSDDAVRTAVARIAFEVGTHDPTVVRPVLGELVDALDDATAGVRMNCARPIAEVAVTDPEAVRFAAPALRSRLDDSSDSVRHSAAWALEWLATKHPDALPPDRAARCLDDAHPPVRKHGCRACALLAAAHPTGHSRGDRLVELLNDDHVAVRAAAAHALGADGSDSARSALTRVAASDLNETVRTAARRALRAATYEATVDGERAPAEPPDRVLSDCLAAGDRAFGRWLRIDAPGVTPRGGRFYGAVIAVDPGADSIEPPPVTEEADAPAANDDGADATEPDAALGDSPGTAGSDSDDADSGPFTRARELVERGSATERSPPAESEAATAESSDGGEVAGTDEGKPYVELRNAPVGYRVRLTNHAGTWRGTYAGHERTGAVTFEPVAVHRLDSDRTPLRHAVEGDRLAFTVEGAPHAVEVTDRETASGRVAGRNDERGYAVEFRPETEGPLRALFEAGRTFEATDLRIAEDVAD